MVGKLRLSAVLVRVPAERQASNSAAMEPASKPNRLEQTRLPNMNSDCTLRSQAIVDVDFVSFIIDLP